MRKFLSIILISLSVVCLFACSNSADVPEGLQIVDDNTAEGYILYGPEGWSIANRGGISASYVSAINTTSITFAKADIAAVPKTDEEFEQYFDDSTSALPYVLNVTKREEKCTFGNASSVRKYIYTYEFGGTDFSCMQILVTHGEDFYIFTYNAVGKISDESSAYNIYLEKVQLAIESFKFKEKGNSEEKPKYEKDSDGYNLVSDKKLAGYDIYLPDSYTVIDNGAMVSAKITGNATVAISKVSGAGVDILEYIKNQRDKLIAIADSYTDVKIGVPKEVDTTNTERFGEWPEELLSAIEVDTSVVFGDLPKQSAISYEYVYEYAGKTYHVYQVHGIDTFSGYTFTYTAAEDEYGTHIDEVMTILKKVRF